MESAGYMSERCRVLPESDKRQSEEKHILTSSITAFRSGHLGAFVFVFFFEDSRISLVLKGLGSFLWIMFKGCMLQGRAFQRSINYFPSPNSYEVSFWNFVLQKIGEAFYFCPAVTVA